MWSLHWRFCWYLKRTLLIISDFTQLVFLFWLITYANILFLKTTVQVNTLFRSSNVFSDYDSEKTCANTLYSTIWTRPQQVLRILSEEKRWQLSLTNHCAKTNEWPGSHTVLPFTTPCQDQQKHAQHCSFCRRAHLCSSLQPRPPGRHVQGLKVGSGHLGNSGHATGIS